MKTSRPPKIRTLEDAYDYVLKVKTCLIFGSKKYELPSLWEVVDLPGRQPGKKGWGQKVESIWAWKNELPEQFPEEIFYGKLPGGAAMLMCLDYLREHHYPAHHRAVSTCRPLARQLYELIRRETQTTPELRSAISPSGKISKSQVDSALVELQVTLNIVRSNAPNLKADTWVPFTEQYRMPRG